MGSVHSTELQFWNRMEADGYPASRSPCFFIFTSRDLYQEAIFKLKVTKV